MKKILILAALLPALLITSCATTAGITVISREDGSGTRGAFVELFGIEEKDADGNKVDHTTSSADITQSTGVMLTSVSSNKNAIGYISLGSLNDTVKALKIDGAEATAENVKNGSYKIARPFTLATTETLNDLAKDFVSFILSEDGQKVILQNDFIPVTTNPAYNSEKKSGKITIAGSSSISPVMEKLKEAYQKINPDVTIEINQSDSTTGAKSVAEGICDIGMVSRELKDSELSSGLSPTTIALDGIVVIVNKENALGGLSKDEVKAIYTGKTTAFPAA